ncbi:uncharacterized protein [Drosophila virilis]|nr:uncharacterized protein LOC6626989 isoform X2 [Drosophila virilis]
MSLPILSSRRCILLLMLAMAAAPMRQAPIEAETEDALATWNWPAGTSKNSYRDFLDNGSPLPKIEAVEMAPEFDDALLKAFNFPLLPLNMHKGWRLGHQRYDKYLKELQLHRTWLDELQSPADDSTARQTSGTQLWPASEDDLLALSGQPGSGYSRTRQQQQRKHKREPSEQKGTRYKPSISAGVMTNLGDFFNQLKANVHFAEHSQQLGEAESQLLEGVHPHPLQKDDDDKEEDDDYDSGQPPDRKTSKLLQSIRSYRPSQKVRSLVSRNPNGYRGSQFIDPSYMWLGLGK